MEGGGYYPTMTSSEWSDAPWNKQEPRCEACPECGGDGGLWYDEDGKEYSVADYERMSEEMRKGLVFDKCERCDGTGEVAIEDDEPEYDNYD